MSLIPFRGHPGHFIDDSDGSYVTLDDASHDVPAEALSRERRILGLPDGGTVRMRVDFRTTTFMPKVGR